MTSKQPQKTAKEAAPETKRREVELSSLGTAEFFTYQGRTYSKRRAGPGGIKALSKAGDELITLPPDTLVTPKE